MNKAEKDIPADPYIDRVTRHLTKEEDAIFLAALQQEELSRHCAQTALEERQKSLLQKADEIIAGDRQRDYGDKLQNFSQIAMLWQGTLAHLLKPDSAITPELVTMCMIQVKLARLAKSPDHADSLLDVAGYAGCMSILQQERIEGKELLGATKDPRELPF